MKGLQFPYTVIIGLMLFLTTPLAFADTSAQDPGFATGESRQVQGVGAVPGKGTPGPKSREVVLEKPGIQVKVPEKNWKVTLYDDGSNPLELLHSSGAIIQMLTFPTTMVNLAEIVALITARYENSLAVDGAKNHKFLGEKDYNTAHFVGKRAKSTFVRGKEMYTLEQLSLEGKDRIYVMVLIARTAAYAKVSRDFEALAASCEPVPAPGEGEPGTQEKKDVQDPGKGNGH